MIGVGFKILGRTPVTKLPPSYPPRICPILTKSYVRRKVRICSCDDYLTPSNSNDVYWKAIFLSMRQEAFSCIVLMILDKQQ